MSGRAIGARLVPVAIVVLMTALFAVPGWLLLVYPGTPGPGRGRVVAVRVTAGMSLSTLAHELVRQGVVARPRAWAVYARVLGAAGRLRTGTVLVRDSMQPREVLRRVATDFGSVELRVTIPEGFDRFDIARELERWGIVGRDAFLHATADPTLLGALRIRASSAEGYLFPDTYTLRDDAAADRLVRRFVDNTRRKTRLLLDLHTSAMQRLAAGLGWGAHEVLTLASVVEKEARVADEQPVIAGVFLNRLMRAEFRPKRLQADPTVAYGCLVRTDLASCAAFDGRHVLPAMLEDAANPYNTYRRDGLPPGPIANPGLDAIRAVLAATQHDYFYFVASGGGRHAFSKTLAEHQAAIRRTRTE